MSVMTNAKNTKSWKSYGTGTIYTGLTLSGDILNANELLFSYGSTMVYMPFSAELRANLAILGGSFTSYVPSATYWSEMHAEFIVSTGILMVRCTTQDGSQAGQTYNIYYR